MNKIIAVATVVIKELYRRKDFYVLFFLTFVITFLLAAMNFFDDPKIVRYLKEVCLLLIWISSLIIAITLAARQIPAERESRTIFPLLAKPVTRGQVIVGKFLGCWLAVGFALVVFYVFFGGVSAWREHRLPALHYFQAMWLQWAMLGIVSAMVLFGSILFTSPAENITICFFIAIGILFAGGHLNTVALQQTGAARAIVYTIYFSIPHLEWYDVRDLITYDWSLVPWRDCVLATGYAAIYVALFLFGAWMLFRRKALTT